MNTRHRAYFFAFMAALGCAIPALAGDCASLAAFVTPGVALVAATAVPAGTFTSPPQIGYASATYTVPAFCRVQAIIAPQITTEVWLPDAWNSRFEGVGNGGLLGAVIYGSLAGVVSGGYATVSSDLGHQSTGSDSSWAAGRPDLVTAFGYTSTHLMTVFAKQMIVAYYGAPATYNYFVGCSAGGRQALMEAQLYPTDYNGIVTCAAAQNWTHLLGGMVWQSLAVMGNPDLSSYLSSTQVNRLYNAVMSACDAIDGLADGQIDDPRKCNFDPQTLACGRVQTSGCLTPAQVTAVKNVYSPLKNSSGTQIYPATPRGSEFEWSCSFLGTAPYNGFSYIASQSFFQSMVYEIPSWDFRTFNADVDIPYADQKLALTLNASSPNLDAFKAAGGKIFMFHGFADGLVSPYASIDYFTSVQTRYGTPATDQFFRLYMLPAWGHCGGTGPSIFDSLGATVNWVENGVVPQNITAYSVNAAGKVNRSRPLCPYPQAEHYLGSGSINLASNFSCQ